MKLRRIISLSIAVLAGSSTVHAFQISKQSMPSAKPAITQSPVVISKQAPGHAVLQPAVAYHVNFQRQSKRHKPIIHRFTFGGRNTSIVRSHTTSVTSHGGSISLAFDIGRPTITASKVTVKNAPSGMAFSQVSWPLLSRQMPSGVTLIPSEGGGPDYPELTVTFAIPATATNIAPVISQVRTAPLGGIHFLPSEQEVKGALTRSYDPKLYSVEPKVEAYKPETFRSLRMVTLRVPLVRSGGTEALESFTVGITYTTSGAQQQGTVRDPLFTDINRQLVANPYDVGRFAVPLRMPRAQTAVHGGKGFHTQSMTSGFDSVTNWIDPSAPYIRLAVTRDGLYRVTASQLNFPNAGLTLASAGWNPKNLRCINHGKEIPIWIDTDASGNIAAIEFYGQRLRGFPLPSIYNITYPEHPLPQYYNVATDTNVYWLTSSNVTAGAPLRYKLRAPNLIGAPVLSSGIVTLHHEQDHNYYTGDAIQDETVSLQMTEYVPGERFYWMTLHGLLDDSTKSHFVDTFYIPKLPADTVGKVASVEFLFRGMSDDNNVLEHVVQAQINSGAPTLPDSFQNFDFDSLKMTVPLSQLVSGPNMARANALTYDSSGVDQFYIDWYEVTFPCALYPSIDTAIAKGQWLFSELPSVRIFQLALSDTSAQLYNLTDGTRLSLQGKTFVDSTSAAAPVYAAATPSSFLQCDNIQPWNTFKTDGWNILNTGNGADYIVLTHPAFMRAANELAANRAGLALRTKVVTTDEVFNAFDYGSNEPVAIRRFLNFAYNNYSGAPVSYVTLLGNASWDPKFNLASSTNRSYVPSYGWPVSDYYYTLPGEGDSNLDVPPLMFIARIPATSEATAESYISKLVEYESAPPAAWNRNFLFLVGGDLANAQHDLFSEVVHGWLDQYLLHDPMNVDSTVVERTDFTSGVDATHVGEIEDALQRGQSIMYFAGHGATFTSDILFPDASILNNKGLYPLLLTLTCQTGAFAEPNMVGVNQSYVDAPEAGAIETYGTTGFGESDYDDALTDYFFAHMKSFDSTHDTTHPQSMNMLALLTASKVYANQFGSASGGNGGHNATLQNTMLGDAATGFVFRPQPELAVYSNEIHAYAGSDSVPKTSLSISDSIMTIRALIHNYGYSTDKSVVIRITDAGPNGLPNVVYDTLPGLDTSAVVSASFALTQQSIGSHEITVVIDPYHTIPESYRGDDSASIQVLVNGLSTTPFYPYEGSRGFCDIGLNSVHFVVLAPAGSGSGDLVELELDTTQQFSNILVDQKTSIGTSYYVTFDISLPPAPVPWSTVYWWRSRVVRANGDTTDWQYATFSTGSASRPEFSYTSPEQLNSTIISGLSLDSREALYLPMQDTMRIEAISHGPDDADLGGSFTPYGQININGLSFYVISGFEGYAILVWTPDGTQIAEVNEFDMPWPVFLNGPNVEHLQDSMAASFDSVLNAIPTSRRVTILTLGEVDYPYFIDSTRSAMLTLGSANGLVPPYNGSYALIGEKGSVPGTAKEGSAPDNSPHGTHIFDTIITSGTSGLAQTPFTAVAKDYGSLTWTGDPIPSGSDITFSVLGARRDGSGTDLVSTFHASSGNSFSLSSIDPRVYDRLAVRMNFVRTSNATGSPALFGIQLQYDAAPELLFSTDSILTSPKLTNAGALVTASYTVSTLTCTPADSVPLILTRQYQSKTDTVATHLITMLGGHASQAYTDSIQTANELGTVALTATINPGEAVNEQLLFNNSIAGSYTVTRDTTKPSIDILFDNRNIPPDGYVSSNAVIKIEMLSSNPQRDTSHASIVAATLVNINNPSQTYQITYYSVPPGFEQPEFGSFPTGPIQAYLQFRPSSPYPPGQWVLTAAVTDASGNTDTLEQQFTISSTNGLEHVMNYPNPFKDKTDFTFVLRNDNPVDVKIIVYTIAGRKIRTLTPLETHAGFNAVEWDGRDERGNEVADGTYLYRVIVNGKNGDNTSDAVTQSAVRDR